MAKHVKEIAVERLDDTSSAVQDKLHQATDAVQKGLRTQVDDVLTRAGDQGSEADKGLHRSLKRADQMKEVMAERLDDASSAVQAKLHRATQTLQKGLRAQSDDVSTRIGDQVSKADKALDQSLKIADQMREGAVERFDDASSAVQDKVHQATAAVQKSLRAQVADASTQAGHQISKADKALHQKGKNLGSGGTARRSVTRRKV